MKFSQNSIQNFHFQSKLRFLRENHKTYNYLQRIHPIYDFPDFPENGRSNNGNSMKNFKNHIKGEFFLVSLDHLSYHFCDFPSKMII